MLTWVLVKTAATAKYQMFLQNFQSWSQKKDKAREEQSSIEFARSNIITFHKYIHLSPKLFRFRAGGRGVRENKQ